nr:MAG TPA: hypothetical protein [Caudoviricetes sp.]
MNEEMKTNEIVDEVIDTEETIQDNDTSDENYEIEEFEEDEKKSSGFGAVAVAGIIGTALIAGGIALYKKYTGKAKKRRSKFGKKDSDDEVVEAEVVSEKKTQEESDNDVYVEEETFEEENK